MSSNEATLFVVGASHHTTPLEWREKLALGPDKLPAFARALSALPGLPEFAILNTCNRVEFYGVAQTGTTIDALADSFCAVQGIAPSEFAAVRSVATGAELIANARKTSLPLCPRCRKHEPILPSGLCQRCDDVVK